ncbi:hypothetical protein B9K06_12905 [Bacillus sp. OG2]|nr:hypothetical protein B9K06_12905 [Bacillus sp. OG2]
MIIRHNISALNTFNRLTKNSKSQSSSIEKLSSGLRINKAADDSAGLAISEKMRAQIRGLDQAFRNAQDGISMIQTGEGALSSVHDILQRMRELAVQSANDVLTLMDRRDIQQEISQQLKEIDKVAASTEFNKQTLLDGSKSLSSVEVSAQFTTYTAPYIGVWEISANPLDGAGRFGITNYDTMTHAQFEFKDSPDPSNPWIDVQIGSDLPATLNNLRDTFYQVKTGGYRFPTEQLALANSDMYIQGNLVIITSSDTFDMSHNPTDGISANGLYSGTPATLSLQTSPGQTVVLDNRLTFQIGANVGQSLTVGFPKITAGELGIDSISVLDYDQSSSAIISIDEAISKISEGRSELGAVQNRLEHTITNLQQSAENLTAAESRIRDIDMAKEMMIQTKNSILSQAAQSMLAHANQKPSEILKLINT